VFLRARRPNLNTRHASVAVKRRITLHAVLAAAVVVGVLVGGAMGQTPPVRATALAPAAGLPMTTEEHWAKDEVKYNNAWVWIDKLFQDYLAAKAELQPLGDKIKAGRDAAAAIQSQLNSMKNESVLAERPTRNELLKANTKRREMARAAEAPEPQKPKLQPIPPQPRYSSSSSSSRWSGSNQYDDPLRRWQQQVDAIRRANDTTAKKYQDDLAQWKKARDDAQKQLPKLDADIKTLDQKLQQFAADLAIKQAPLMEKYKAISEEILGIDRQVSAVETRIQNMVEALQAAPEALRLKHGICEWEGGFSLLADLEKLYETTQADINRVHAQLKAEAQQAGRPFPENWRHPQQDRMDALKAIVTKAKAAVAPAP
jgi:DNA repair exonuclease SbcCD ATPase subunit